jgi:two-component system response regulator RegX3
MTGDSEAGGLTRLFDVCLRKPFSLDALLQAMEDARMWGQRCALLAA